MEPTKVGGGGHRSGAARRCAHCNRREECWRRRVGSGLSARAKVEADLKDRYRGKDPRHRAPASSTTGRFVSACGRRVRRERTRRAAGSFHRRDLAGVRSQSAAVGDGLCPDGGRRPAVPSISAPAVPLTECRRRSGRREVFSSTGLFGGRSLARRKIKLREGQAADRRSAGEGGTAEERQATVDATGAGFVSFSAN